MSTSVTRRASAFGAGPSSLKRAGAVVLVLALLATALVLILRQNGVGRTNVTAIFDEAVNVHEGDEVRILGVKVGSVESVQPEADRVVVELSFSDDYELAADATAAVVTPTLVSVRYIQLGPLANEGDNTLADGAVIPKSLTASPLEWDDIKSEVDDLVSVLGPREGTNGALRRLVTASADNVEGQGTSLRATLTELAGAFDTLSRGREDLFSVVQNLGTFVDALAANDAQVAVFNQRLATVAGVLGENRGNLAQLLDTLDRSTSIVTEFVRQNRSRLSDTVSDLASITQNLAASRQALADVLQRAPIAVSNLHNIYDPFSGALTTSAAVANFNDPAQFLCGIAMGASPEGPTSTDARRYCETALDPLLDLIQMPSPPIVVNPNDRDPDNAPKENQ